MSFQFLEPSTPPQHLPGHLSHIAVLACYPCLEISTKDTVSLFPPSHLLLPVGTATPSSPTTLLYLHFCLQSWTVVSLGLASSDLHVGTLHSVCVSLASAACYASCRHLLFFFSLGVGFLSPVPGAAAWNPLPCFLHLELPALFLCFFPGLDVAGFLVSSRRNCCSACSPTLLSLRLKSSLWSVILFLLPLLLYNFLMLPNPVPSQFPPAASLSHLHSLSASSWSYRNSLQRSLVVFFFFNPFCFLHGFTTAWSQHRSVTKN